MDRVNVSARALRLPFMLPASPQLPTRPSSPVDGPSAEEDDAYSCNWLIYKVPRRLLEVNERAYEPNAIFIGPYHHGKQHLRAMEDIKLSCLNKILEKTNLQYQNFLKPMKLLEKPVRKCYEETHDLDSDRFVSMMILDGCFLIQLIREIYPGEHVSNLGPHTENDVWYDLLLLENQLPFFLLLELDRIINQSGGGDLAVLARLALRLFKKAVQGLMLWSESENYPSPKTDIKHLLDLVHSYCHPSQQYQDFKAKASAAAAETGKEAEAEAEAKKPKSRRSWKFIRSATELEEAGISFFDVQDHQDQDSTSLFDIIFTEDTQVLKIPTLYVGDNTECLLRNFMAYEQFIRKGQPTYVTDYVMFMNNLVKSGKDVQLLCNSGIIDNWLGNDEVVGQMFNKLGDFIYRSEDFYYADIFGKVNEHCQRKWNKYKAMLKRDYFNSPWSFISFLAAVVLLLLTLLQTIFSVLSYDQPERFSFYNFP